MELKIFIVVKVIIEVKRNFEKILSSNGKRFFWKSYVESENFKIYWKEKVELRVGECLRGEWVNCLKEVRRKWIYRV